MKGSAFILFLILSSFAFGQAKEVNFSKEETPASISSFIPVDTVAWTDLTGDYSGSPGDGELVISGRWEFTLNANGTFKSFEGCIAVCLKDSGYWSVKKNKLQLKLKQRTISFDILKLSNFYFFIFPSQHKYFTSDFQSLKEIAERAKLLAFDDYMMAHCLSAKYFSKEIKLTLSEAVLPAMNRE